MNPIKIKFQRKYESIIVTIMVNMQNKIIILLLKEKIK